MITPRRIQRRRNMLLVLHHCLAQPRTLSEIAQLCGITRPAAEAVVSDLVDFHWISETNSPDGVVSAGRPASFYQLSASAGHVLSIDIGAHHISAITADLAGNILVELHVEVPEELPADLRLQRAIEIAESVLKQTDCGETLTCTVASPGVLHEGKVAYFGGEGMPGWQGIQLDKSISEALQVRVETAGDCALGARGESWLGAAAEHKNVVFILAGMRTGAASVIDGRVHQGFQGAAGLIGELPQLRWRSLEEETFASKIYGDNEGKPVPTRETIFELARRGNQQAIEASKVYGETLGLGVAAMILAIAPESVVIGGQFSPHVELFLPSLTESLAKTCPFLPPITASKLGARAVVLGGVRHALDCVFDQLNDRVINAEYFPTALAESLWK